MSYAQLLDWLEVCAAKCRAPSVVALLHGFKTYVQREFQGVQDMDEVDGLVEAIVGNPERLNAALTLFEAEAATRKRLIGKFVRDVQARVSARAG
jgi:hypothetical protein